MYVLLNPLNESWKLHCSLILIDLNSIIVEQKGKIIGGEICAQTYNYTVMLSCEIPGQPEPIAG